MRCWRYIGLAFISGDWFFDMICSWVMNCDAVMMTTITTAMTTTTTSTGSFASARLDAVVQGAMPNSDALPNCSASSWAQQADARVALVRPR